MDIAYPVSPLAPGRHVDLPGRGTTFVRELDGPPGAPTVLLLHGWMATGGLNWNTTMAELARRFHVVAMDMRGHGRGMRSDEPFTYEAAADDAAALIQQLGRGPVIVGGFSMGGPIAEVLWQRHPKLVSGLVLVSSVGKDHNSLPERAAFNGLHAVFRRVPGVLFTPWWVPKWFARSRWLRPVDELGRSDARRVVEAGQVAGTYDVRPFQRHIDVPVSVVVSARDLLVSPAEQRANAAAIPGADVVELQGGHLAFFMRAHRFASAVAAAAESVRARIGALEA